MMYSLKTSKYPSQIVISFLVYALIMNFSFAQNTTGEKKAVLDIGKKAEEAVKNVPEAAKSGSLEKKAEETGKKVSEAVVPAEKKPVEIDKKSEEVLKKLSEFHAAQKSIKVIISQVVKSEREGKMTESKHDYDVQVEKPNKLNIKSRIHQQQILTISDGKKLYTYKSGLKEYMEKDASEDFDASLKSDGGAVFSSRFNSYLAIVFSMMTKNPYENLTQVAEKIEYKGQEDVSGTKQDHLRITEKDRNYDLWITSGENPQIVKSVPDMEKVIKTSGMQPPGKIEVEINFSNWKFNEQSTADNFTFTPAKDDKKVESFTLKPPDITFQKGPEKGPEKAN